MEWAVSLTVYLSVFQAAFGFNIDPVVWKSLSYPNPSPGDGFGYKVVQRQSSILVSAPTAPLSQDRSGQIYNCSTESCSPMSIEVPDFAVNMSLGLTMTNDPTTGKTIACGPTLSRECKAITTYNGLCLEINANDRIGLSVPLSLAECPGAADIAFLLDGSGSVSLNEFNTMKTFVKTMIASLLDRATQFAVIQYSNSPATIHYHFDQFVTSGSWQSQIDGIRRRKGGTYTAAAMRRVVERVFSGNRGSRQNVNKFLIVITDGDSSDSAELNNAASLAAREGIVRFAIGVGDAFTKASAKAELDIIATDPSKHVFRVTNFQALDGIGQALQNSIFPIEGSQSGGSLKLEMAQEGFSAANVPGGEFQMAAVGAYQWRGSYQEVSTEGQREDFKEISDMEPDSYLGYSMAIAMGKSGMLTVIGAPRFKHMGMAMVFSSGKLLQTIDPSTKPRFPIGAYFGAEVCTMNVDGDQMGYTDVILISAPSFMEEDSEGRVYICSLTGMSAECLFDNQQSVLKGVAGERGRFGSSLAPLPDLNRDGFNDLAVGAPLENDGQGSIYIFHGAGRRKINPMYSQRIPGSDVQPGLSFFGLSLSQSSFDLSGDSLPDLAVGSKGAVVLLRSKPIVMVEAEVTFSPAQIPTNNTDCNSPLNNTATVCFTMTLHSSPHDSPAQARINYTLTLDSTRKTPNNRAYIKTQKQRELFKSFTLDRTKQDCFSHDFNIEACPEDALNELRNELHFTFEGVPSSENLSPSLAQQAQTTNHPLGFEINCGTDDRCTDNLKVDFNFTSSREVQVGIHELLNVMVSVENREEDSYNSRVTLTYPPGLSYRTFTTQKGRVECNSIDAENGLSRGKSDCTIDKPIFKSNAKVLFTVSYGIDTNSELDKKMRITANATSGNVEHSPESELYQQNEIDVKYSLFLYISNPSSLSYTNFTFGRNDLQTPLPQSITVLNSVRAFNVTVVIKVPVRLGDKDIWVNPGSIKIPGCKRYKDEEPIISDFVDNIKENPTVDCSVATCTVFRCNVFMVKNQQDVYNISANLSSGWIEQIGLQSAKFRLISTATLEYDRDQYIFFSPQDNNNPPVQKIVATVEVYTETDLTNAIIGGSVGGLVLLALITAGLIKAGFFKSQYKQMIADQDGEGQGPEDGGAQPPEEQQ